MDFIDLFCGIGGVRLAFEKHFGKCVFSSDFDKYVQMTYEANFGEKPSGDITKIDPNSIPDFDILLGGFPCQPFSIAGRCGGFNDTRGTLFYNIAEIISCHRPEVVFLENVYGLKIHNKGDTLKAIVRILKQMGYSINIGDLNAKDFGIPQARRRLYLVCFKGDVDFSFPEPTFEKMKVGDILEKEVAEKYTISDKRWTGEKRRKDDNIKKGNGFGYSLFNGKSLYTSTILANYYKDCSKILIEQGEKNPRKLTPREAARLQGFPDDFEFPVSNTQAYKQIGNSVCIPVVEKIARQIKIALTKGVSKNIDI